MTLAIPIVPTRRLTAARSALWLDFKRVEYLAAGLRYSALSGLPGHSFTRTGTQGAVDAGGAVQWFAANVPAINSAGYHAYAAATNLEPYSQEMNLRTLTAATATANTTVAPDGTTTADTLTSTGGAARTNTNLTVTSSTTYTSSVFIPSGGTATHAWIWPEFTNGTTLASTYIIFDRATGTIANTVVSVAGMTITGYAVAVSGGWRFVVVYTTLSDTTAMTIRYGLSKWATNYISDGGETMPMWQCQTLAGSFAAGGPLISTSAAAASIGASGLEVSQTLPASDFIVWAIIRLSSLPAANVNPFGAWNGTNNERLYVQISTGGVLSDVVVAGNVSQATGTNPTPIASGGGRAAVMLRRRSGFYSVAAKKTDGTILIGTDGASTGAIPAVTEIHIGAIYNDTGQINGQVEGLYQRNGTFSDVEITAMLSAA